MNRTREVIFMGIGILTGITLCGPAAQAADYLKATFSTQPIYVNGQRVQMEAYSIHGNNFVKLRDIGQAVDFGVEYDPATNSVHIDPNSSYQEEVKQGEQTPASPSAAPSEEAVQAAIKALKTVYPSGTVYPAPYRSTSNGPYGVSSTNCAGWATLCSDTAFGDLPWRRVDRPSWEQIRAGDLVEYRNGTTHHVVVVLDRTDEYISTTESGTNNKARWGGQYPQPALWGDRSVCHQAGAGVAAGGGGGRLPKAAAPVGRHLRRVPEQPAGRFFCVGRMGLYL